jgi:Ca2+-binding EF-hand superfamily protein
LVNLSRKKTHIMALSQSEIDDCRVAFDAMETNRKGYIRISDLSEVFEKLDKWLPNEEQLYQMSCTLNLQTLSGYMDFGHFLNVASIQKEKAENVDFENDMVDAFISCGGNEDTSGNVKRDTLIQIIKYDFGLTIDIEELIDQVDADGSGEIEFDEFKELLS